MVLIRLYTAIFEQKKKHIQLIYLCVCCSDLFESSMKTSASYYLCLININTRRFSTNKMNIQTPCNERQISVNSENVLSRDIKYDSSDMLWVMPVITNSRKYSLKLIFQISNLMKKKIFFFAKKKKIQTKIKTNNNLIDELTCPFQYSIYRDADSYRLVM